MRQSKMFQVAPTEDYKVYIYYENGEIKLYDCSWILEKDGAWKPLHDVDTFMDTCVLMNGTLSWDISGKWDPTDCIDICPDVIYKDSVKSSCILTIKEDEREPCKNAS